MSLNIREKLEENVFKDFCASIHKAIFKYYKNTVHTTLHEEGVKLN
jgi:hypothetical protein